MLPSHSDMYCCYQAILTCTVVTKPFWHVLLLPSHSDMLLPNYSDICHVTKPFWCMLCYQAIQTSAVLLNCSDIGYVTKPFWHMLCYQAILTWYVTRMFWYAMLPDWHMLNQSFFIKKNDMLCYLLLIHFGIISSDMFVLAALMQGSVWYERKMRKVVMKRGSRWQ